MCCLLVRCSHSALVRVARRTFSWRYVRICVVLILSRYPVVARVVRPATLAFLVIVLF